MQVPMPETQSILFKKLFFLSLYQQQEDKIYDQCTWNVSAITTAFMPPWDA